MKIISSELHYLKSVQSQVKINGVHKTSSVSSLFILKWLVRYIMSVLKVSFTSKCSQLKYIFNISFCTVISIVIDLLL